ncbi:MAG: hypothetical protein QXL94_03480 [Candidatus Parvarchaeum sp.]
MNDEKDAYYYFEKLKERGLNTDKYFKQLLSPIQKNNIFPNENIFMNWLIESDFIDLRTMNDIIFAIYSNPSSEENIVINKYIKEEKREQEISKLSDECTELVLYLLKILTNLKNYETDDLIKIHEETSKKADELKDKLNNIISGAFEYFKKKERKDKNEPYIG